MSEYELLQQTHEHVMNYLPYYLILGGAITAGIIGLNLYKTTSMYNRYMNAEFRVRAEEMGLEGIDDEYSRSSRPPTRSELEQLSKGE